MIWINPRKKSLSESVRFRPKLLLFTLLPHELSKSVNYSSEWTIAAVPQADVAGQEILVTILSLLIGERFIRECLNKFF